MLLDSIQDVKNFRLMDTGHKPFVTEAERIKQSAANVGLGIPDLEGAAEGSGLEEKYIREHQERFEEVMRQAGKEFNKK